MPIEKWSDHIAMAHLSSDPQLGDELALLIEQIAETSEDLVLDVAGVRYINSSHLSKFLKLRKVMVGSDRHLILAAVPSPIWGTFLVTGLDKIFEFAEDVPTALAALQMSHASRSDRAD